MIFYSFPIALNSIDYKCIHARQRQKMFILISRLSISLSLVSTKFIKVFQTLTDIGCMSFLFWDVLIDSESIILIKFYSFPFMFTLFSE